MPNFGDYETVGEPLAVLNLQGHSSAVWKARKAGAPDNREFIVKSYSPHHPAREGEAGDALDRDHNLEFLEGVKQLKKAHDEDPRCLVPVHDFGITPDGAWYASDFYQRGSLMSLIGKKAKVDSAALKQIVGSIVAACLALQKSRGVSHGNLKASNVFLAGKPRPLPKTQIVLADPVPATLPFARLDSEERGTINELLHQTAEVQDLRALGEIILQLVERRIIRSGYCDPPQRSELWDGLGKDGERWRQLCVQLLDPQLSLAEINLASLAKKFPAGAGAGASGKAVLVAAAVAALCLLGGSVYGIAHWNTHRHDEKCRELTDVAQQAFQSGDLMAAQKNIIEALKWRPENAAALNLGATIEKQIERQYDLSVAAATEKSTAKRWSEALNDLNEAFRLKPDGAEALSLKKQIETAQAAAANQAALEQQYQSAMEDARTKLAGGDYAGAAAQADTALKCIPGDPAAQRLKDDALKQQADALAAAQRAGYDSAMQSGHAKLAVGDYAGALLQVEAALKSRPNDDAALQLQKEALAKKAAAATVAQHQKDYENAMQMGREKYANGDYAGAISQADSALAIKANDADALKLKGDAVAQRTAMNAAAQKQKDYENTMQTGREKYANGDYAGAISQANLALASKGNDTAALKLKSDAQGEITYHNAMQSGQAKYDAGDYASAISQADSALAIKANDAAALKLKGDAVARHQAVQNYTAAMLAATNAWSHAEYQFQHEQFDEALTNLQSALNQCAEAGKYGQGSELRQLQSTLQLRLGQMTTERSNKLEHQRKYLEAMTAATNAWKQATADYDKPDYNAALADSQTALNQCSEAGKYGQGPEVGQLENYLKLFQTAVHTAQDRKSAQGDFEQGQYEQAAALCKAHPDDEFLKNLTAKISLESNQLAQAEAKFDQGDYSFVDDWQKTGYPKKSLFESLLTSAKPEADVFNQLKGLTGDSANWAKVNAIVTSSSNAKFINKNGFAPFRSWWSRNDPVKMLDAKLAAFEVFAGIRPPNSAIVNPYGNGPAVRWPRGTQLDFYYGELDNLKKAYQKQGGDQSSHLSRIKAVENVMNTM